MRLRIVCRPLEPLEFKRTDGQSSAYPRVNQIMPDISDCEVRAVEDDGTEHLIDNVTGISWAVDETGDRIPRASIKCDGVEVDVEAFVRSRRVR